MGVVAVFEVAATLLLCSGLYLRPKNRYLSNIFLASAGVVAALPALAFLALFLHRNDPP